MLTKTNPKARNLLLAGFLSLAMLLVAACTPEQNEAYTYINESRTGTLKDLMWHGDLGTRAQVHAERMASEGRIFHTDLRNHYGPYIGSWCGIGENVGVGGSIKTIHNAYLNSPGHRANIMGTSWTHAGTGVAIGKDGRTYTVQAFMKGC